MYIKRALCLSKTLDKSLIFSLKVSNTLDCSYNISNLILKLLHDVPSTINEFNRKKCKTSSKIIAANSASAANRLTADIN